MGYRNRHRRSRRHKHSNQNYSHNYSNGCSFCGKNLEGLPHRCKYCGQVHCSDHLLPEDHKCQGINQERKFGFKPTTYTPEITYEQPRYPQKYSPHFSNRPQRTHFNRPNFRMPRIRLPRISKFFLVLIVAVASYFLAFYYPKNTLFLWIEFFAWAYLTILIYRKPFRWVNRVSMANDLTFFGLRVLGAIIDIVIIYFSLGFLFASMLVGGTPAPINIPIFCLLAGLFGLSTFILFRTNRRHNVIGVWRA